jgi:hypothetical protein
MITFLHTTRVNVQRFEDLVRKYDPCIEIRHYVNEDLLQYALIQGKADGVAFREEAEQIRKESPGLIICTCSSYGDECDNVSGVERIDQPAVEYLVDKYDRIGLAYTVRSTVPISRRLIEKSALRSGKPVQVLLIDCSSCWRYLEEGDSARYEAEIANIVKNDASGAEAIFLAQASMEGAKKYLPLFTREVMASPDYGVQQFLKKV